MTKIFGNIGDVKKITYDEDIFENKKDAAFWLNEGADPLSPLVNEIGPKEI